MHSVLTNTPRVGTTFIPILGLRKPRHKDMSSRSQWWKRSQMELDKLHISWQGLSTSWYCGWWPADVLMTSLTCRDFWNYDSQAPAPGFQLIILESALLSSDSDVKESASNAGDLGSIPGLGSSPGEGNGKSLQYSCLENPITEEPGRLQWGYSGRLHGVTKSQTWLSN